MKRAVGIVNRSNDRGKSVGLGQHAEEALRRLREHNNFKFIPTLMECIATGKLDLDG
jgi:hypothetical protein